MLLLFLPSAEAVERINSATSCSSPTSNWCQIGTSGFSTMDPSNWYEIETFSYPVTTPLSINRSRGSTQGNIQLTDTGLIIGQSGNYSVSVTAILLNTGNDPILIPMFLVLNGIFDPSNPSIIGGVGTLLPGQITTIQATGVLEYVTPGTALSLVATNGGNPDPVPITVVGWGITVFRINCNPTPQL